MARKRSALGTLLKLGGLAAAGAAIYKNRDAIRGFVDELVGNLPGQEPIDVEIYPEEIGEDEPVRETDIVIDNSGASEEE